jgi:GNAT superfamily N-acetyltransferase
MSEASHDRPKIVALRVSESDATASPAVKVVNPVMNDLLSIFVELFTAKLRYPDRLSKLNRPFVMIRSVMIALNQAVTPEEIEAARTLFREYEAWLGMSLCFQSFEEEVANLPGSYAAPEGRLYLANVDEELAGCIALRKIGEGICEMKRLFLRENARGKGLGNRLIETLIADAQEIGYLKMRLDTYPPKMGKAVKLYESHGFRPIEPYYNNPHDGVLFMERDLLPWRSSCRVSSAVSRRSSLSGKRTLRG